MSDDRDTPQERQTGARAAKDGGQTDAATDAGKRDTAGRDDRLRAALRANMARRKAQARARGGKQAHGERAGSDKG